MAKTIFNARLIDTGHRIASISGRLGPFIFRTLPDGRITAYYKPKHGASSTRYRSNYESLSVQLQEIADQLGLTVTSINYNQP